MGKATTVVEKTLPYYALVGFINAGGPQALSQARPSSFSALRALNVLGDAIEAEGRRYSTLLAAAQEDGRIEELLMTEFTIAVPQTSVEELLGYDPATDTIKFEVNGTQLRAIEMLFAPVTAPASPDSGEILEPVAE